MELQYKQLNELPFWQRLRTARAISKVVCAEAANDKMKQVTARALLARKFSLVALDGAHVAGHVSVEGPIVGALFVGSEHRNKRIAAYLVAAATDFVIGQGLEPVAYCNERSVGVFTYCGYSEMISDKPNRTKMHLIISAAQTGESQPRTLMGMMMAA